MLKPKLVCRTRDNTWKSLFRVILFTTILIVLFSLLLLPSTADKVDSASSLVKSTPSLDVSPLMPAQITFTPVVTVYLSIVLDSYTPMDINVELPNGFTYPTGEEVEVIITVSSSIGVDNIVCGVFTQNSTPLVGWEKECNGMSQCRIEESFSAPLIPGKYFVGVEALDVKGATETKKIEFDVE